MPNMKVGLFRPSSSAASSRPRTARHSIRGRISGPIPIPSPGMDDEFPIRNPGTGIATKMADDEFPIRRRGAGIASPTPLEMEDEPTTGTATHANAEAVAAQKDEVERPLAGEVTEDSVSDTPSPLTAVQEDVTPEPPAQPEPQLLPAPIHHPEPAPAPAPAPEAAAAPAVVPRASPPRHRTNASNAMRYSQVSTASTSQTGQTKDGNPQRKKSTLRGALSKLFGRKKKSASQGSNEVRIAEPVGNQFQRSEPTAPSRKSVNGSKRSASLPITEFDRALRSHSVGPQNIIAIDTARSSLQLSTEANPSRRRVVTATSRLFLQRRGELEEHLGLSPRPASTHGRASRLEGADDDDPSQIGRAITSDHFGTDLRHRRRSRSMSGLQQVADQSSSLRRRSDEIRYWRESQDPDLMSPISSGNGGDDYGDPDDTGAHSFAFPDFPVLERVPKTPPQPFHFGPMSMAGMKITQAASMETRIDSLEGRVHRIERVVEQLCHAVPGFKAPLMEVSPPHPADQIPRSIPDQQPFAYTSAAPPAIPAIYQTIAADLKGGGGNAGSGGASSPRYSSSRHSADNDTDAHSSRMSFGEGQTYIGSLHPPSSSATQNQTQQAGHLSPGNRTSTATVRPAVSMPTIGSARTTPPNEQQQQQTDVAAELEAERAARQALEAQVKKLSDRLNLLSTTMFAMVRDPHKSRSQERLNKSSATPPVPPIRSPALNRSQRSMFEEDSDLDDIKRKLTTGSNTPSDAFLTPREELGSPQYGAFGEELREEEGDDDGAGEDPKRKRAARTLSLSQLTLGKGRRT